MPLIMPIKDLRNTTEISNIAHKEQEPIFITKNGYSDLVVMSSELYDKFARMNRIDQAIFESEQEINNGAEAVDAEKVFADLEKNILDKYKVKVNPRAIRELDHIYEYIANEKLAPENAKEQVDRIKKAILGLETFPQSHQERNEGRYAAKGYHQLLIDNYIAIFRIDEPNKTVYVLTIQYQG